MDDLRKRRIEVTSEDRFRTNGAARSATKREFDEKHFKTYKKGRQLACTHARNVHDCQFMQNVVEALAIHWT